MNYKSELETRERELTNQVNARLVELRRVQRELLKLRQLETQRRRVCNGLSQVA